jgi:hypothetical protein
MCGAPATSLEHFPPLCIFPEMKKTQDGIDYRKVVITVPSCDAHNLENSTDVRRAPRYLGKRPCMRYSKIAGDGREKMIKDYRA